MAGRYREWRRVGALRADVAARMLGGSLLAQLSNMCGGDISVVLEVAAGRPYGQRVTPPRAADGLADSIRFLLSDASLASRRLLRLLTCDDSREPRRAPA